jgi:hypothetical protein
MKKLLLALCVVGVMFTAVPAFAQTAPTQEELTQQLVVLLTELVKQLQQQLADMLAAQANQTQVITQIQQNTQQIATNTTPSGSTISQPVYEKPTCTLSVKRINSSAQLDWTSENADSASLYFGIGINKLTKAIDLNPQGTRTWIANDWNNSNYEIEFTGKGGTATCDASLEPLYAE